MTIWVNQIEQVLEEDSLSLLELLIKLKKAEKKGIAVAMNNSVIPKNNWSTTTVKNLDKITIITATQGG